MMGAQGMAGGFGFFWIIPLIFIGLCVYMMFFSRHGMKGCGPMMGGHGHGDDKPTSDGSPADIAKRRYAGGEIDQEEYQRIIKDLGQ